MRPPLIGTLVALLTTLAFGWSVGAPAAASGSTKWYDVEVVVFSRLNHGAGAAEHWPLRPGLPPLNKAMAIASSNQSKANTGTINADNNNKAATETGKPQPYSELPAQDEQLQGIWRRLKRSAAYHPLLHLAWTQPVGQGIKPKPVLIELSPQDNAVTYPAPDVRMRNLPLLGTVKLSPGRDLHLHIDLLYRAPTHNPTYPAAARTALPSPISMPAPRSMVQPAPLAHYQSYRLDQRRAIDSGDLNYFDHPVFGVIALVTPHASPANQTDATQSP